MSVSWNDDQEIRTNPNVVSNPIEIEVYNPMISDKLPVSQQAFNGVNAKQINVTLKQFNVLTGGGITKFWHNFIQMGKATP